MKIIILTVLIALSSSARAETWLDSSAWSHHMNRATQRQFNLNEQNYGLAIESGNDDLRAVGGYYKNSFYRSSWYFGAQWTPLSLGPIRFGAQGGGVTGYCGHGLIRPYAAAVISIEGARYGFNMAAVPPASKLGGGVISAQFKYRF